MNNKLVLILTLTLELRVQVPTSLLLEHPLSWNDSFYKDVSKLLFLQESAFRKDFFITLNINKQKRINRHFAQRLHANITRILTNLAKPCEYER